MGSDSKRESNAAEEELEIPPGVMELVQHLKEVVDNSCTYSEIYAVLMECNMDPNETVARLLAQGLSSFLFLYLHFFYFLSIYKRFSEKLRGN